MRTTLFGLLDQLHAAVVVPEPIVEFGGAPAAEQRHLRAVRSCFPGRTCFTSDLVAAPGVDHVQDLHDLGLASLSVGTALVLDTIEHLERPWRAMEEVYRCLQPGGVALVTSVFYFPVHQHPEDYWRFTAPAIDVLLHPFDRSVARQAGHPALPHTAVGLAAKDPFDDATWTAAVAVLDRWVAHGATSWKERALMVLPPRALVSGYAGFRRLSLRRNAHRVVDPGPRR